MAGRQVTEATVVLPLIDPVLKGQGFVSVPFECCVRDGFDAMRVHAGRPA